MEQYRTSGTLDETALNEIKPYFVSGKIKWLTRILAAVYMLLGLIGLLAKGGFYVETCFVLAAILALLPRLLSGRFVKVNADRLRESYPGGVRTMESYFDQDGMVVINRSGGGNARIFYPAFNRVSETEHYFFVGTKAGQFCLVFKSFLTAEERTSFIPFLQEKCPKIKVVR